MSDPASREEVYESVRRLDAADAALREQIDKVERELRAEGHAALAAAEVRFAQSVQTVKDDLADDLKSVSGGVRDVRNALTWQNRTAIATVLSGVTFFVVAALEHAFGL